MIISNSKYDKAAKVVIHMILIFFSICCIIPFIAVLSISFSSEVAIGTYGYSLFPKEFSMEAYKFILESPETIMRSYWVTIKVCAVGTMLSLFIMSLCAYPLSRKDFKYRNAISFYIFFTMIFSGGLVPTYIWVSKYLNLGNNFWVLVLPAVVSPWYLMLMRTFFQTIPYEIIESATIDGAGELEIYCKIIIPLAKPALATVGLFTLLGFWNDWFRGLLYIEDQSLVTLQYMLHKMMANIQELQNAMASGVGVSVDMTNLPNESARMAMCVLAAGPMIFVFPFFQKYFVKGLTVGSVKG
ncbi:MAG: carbohydrate ABC transporter permease [Cellulosilyticaceae bacterium]